MGRYITVVLALMISYNTFGGIVTPNVLILDSSFAPIEFLSGKKTPKNCLLVNENNVELSDKGECYNANNWTNVGTDDLENLKGFQDILSGKKDSKAALKWKEISKKSPKQARKVRNNYIVSTHGSRSAYIIDKFSEGEAKILFIRNLTSGIGGVKAKTKGRNKAYRKYSNGCGFYNWSKEEIAKFKNGKLQSYQERISSVLLKNKGILLANISLGYKKSWVQEDNPRCNQKQVNKEFEVLTLSWRNLISKFPNVLFFAAAGNENENFNNPILKKNDLWSLLLSKNLSNLLLVGSTYKNGTKFRSSNYGKPVKIMALGNNIEIHSALPKNLKGHPTTVRGTSFSTPLVVGTAVKFLNAQTNILKLKKNIISHFFVKRKMALEKSFIDNCDNMNAVCLSTIVSLLSGPFLWGETDELFSAGKKDWDYSPFPIEYVVALNSSAKLKIEKFKTIYLPKLLIGKVTNSYDLLLALHHEIYHYSQIKKASQYFYQKGKIDNCVTKYQLSLARDERPAFLSEIKFYNNAPKWFKNGVKKLTLNSRLLSKKKLTYDEYYKELTAKLEKDPNFVINRYIDIGEYPLCMKKLVSNTR